MTTRPLSLFLLSRGRAGGCPHTDRGVALVVALVFLLLLTILGVTVMNTAALEGRMAGNTQETNRAFQAAESAIEHVFVDGGVFNNLATPGSTTDTTLKYPTTDPQATVKVTVTYARKLEKMPRVRNRSNINSVTDYGAAVFDLQSAATTNAQAKTELKQGVDQPTPNNN
jgi:Tfp pilus assembly protein PilX